MLVLLAAAVAAAWLVPATLHNERLHRRLERALERSFGAPVRFESASLRLLPRPGFSLTNVVIAEDSEFGFEPFARADQVICDLRWKALLHSRMECGRLVLERPSFNIVRNSLGRWNLARFFEAGGSSPDTAAAAATAGRVAEPEVLEADGGRIDFKLGDDKKPFAIKDVRIRLEFVPNSKGMTLRLEGNPWRADLSVPTPGVVALEGEWRPRPLSEGSVDFTLHTRGAMLYDWVPLITGRNPGIYGLIDADVRIAGSPESVRVEGEARISQLRRLDELPPAEPMPLDVNFRGRVNRAGARLNVDSLEASFAGSRLHMSGTVENFSPDPRLDLVLAIERSRLEDIAALATRLSAFEHIPALSGRVNGIVTVQGPWSRREYGGFVSVREATLGGPSGTFPLSNILLRIDRSGVELSPVRLDLAPRIGLTASGALFRPGADPALRDARRPSYQVTLATKSAPLSELIRFGRELGVTALRNLDARGVATAKVTFAGWAWPLENPSIQAAAELRAARVVLPGLTEPLNIPRAQISVMNDRIAVVPLLAVVGRTVFNGRLRHEGSRAEPWHFEIRTNAFSFEEASLWFDVLGRRQPTPLLERIPGLGSLFARRAAAGSLFSHLNASGTFSAGAVTYRAVALRDFKSDLSVAGRVVRIANARFRAGGGRGEGLATIDLTSSPARVLVDASLKDAGLEPLRAWLPESLRQVRGAYSGSVRLEARGLSSDEMAQSLRGQASVQLKNVSFGEFDPLAAMARTANADDIESESHETVVRDAMVALQIHDQKVTFATPPLQLGGAAVRVAGSCGFDRTADLGIHVRPSIAKERPKDVEADASATLPAMDLRLAGKIDKLSVVPEGEVVRLGH